MNTKPFTDGLKKVGKVLNEQKPHIAVGVGIGASITAVIFMQEASIKANEIIKEEKKSRKERGESDEITKKETIKITWRYYVKPVVAEAVSIGAILWANYLQDNRYNGVFAAYQFTEAAYSEFKNKTRMMYGDKHTNEIMDEVNSDHMAKHPVTESTVIMTDTKLALCYDTITETYFESSVNKIEKIINDLNRRMMNEQYVLVSEYCYDLGIPSMKGGDDLGWHIDNGFLDVYFGAQLTDDDRPCVVINHRNDPRYI